MQIGDTLEVGGSGVRWKVVSSGPRDSFVLRSPVTGVEREVTIRTDWRGHCAVYWHDEVTFMHAEGVQHFIIRMNANLMGDERGEIIAAGSEGAMKAAWRLLMPGVPAR